MKEFILISRVFLISFLAACAATPTKSVLEERAGYGVNAPSFGIQAGKSVSYVPTRIPEKVTVAWLFPHPLPSKDYFWGSWISLIVAPEDWEMLKVDVPKNDKTKLKRTQERPSAKPKKGK